MDEPYWSLTLGTAFPLMDNGEGKVKESCFIFFPKPATKHEENME